jgi:hypothetical protein
MSEVKNVEGKEKEDWMQQKWRPAMGWMYMGVCVCDFVIFPVLWSLHQAVNHGQVANQWQPLTLNGAGLFHMAMGAVLGIAAYGRTQEKMAGAAGGNGSTAPNIPSFTPPNTSSFGATSTPTPSFGGSAAPAFMPAPPPSFGSKPTGPGPTSFPEL